MRAVLLVLALIAAGGCANRPQEPSTADSGIISGEVGEPRNRARLHTELGSAYYDRGNMAVALDELRQATSADSSYALAYNMLGRVYMDLGEKDLAQTNFERALSLSPSDPDINHFYGWFLCQNGREAESIKYFQQATRNPLYPTPWRSYSAAGVCTLRTKNAKQAEEFFQRALKMDPDEPVSLLQLGQIRYQQGNMDDARRLVGRYNKIANPTPESLWLALRIERKMGERIAEQSYANQLRRRFPGSKEYQALQRGQYE